jgi:hypothetical protein
MGTGGFTLKVGARTLLAGGEAGRWRGTCSWRVGRDYDRGWRLSIAIPRYSSKRSETSDASLAPIPKNGSHPTFFGSVALESPSPFAEVLLVDALSSSMAMGPSVVARDFLCFVFLRSGFRFVFPGIVFWWS